MLHLCQHFDIGIKQSQNLVHITSVEDKSDSKTSGHILIILELIKVAHVLNICPYINCKEVSFDCWLFIPKFFKAYVFDLSYQGNHIYFIVLDIPM